MRNKSLSKIVCIIYSLFLVLIFNQCKLENYKDSIQNSNNKKILIDLAISNLKASKYYYPCSKLENIPFLITDELIDILKKENDTQKAFEFLKEKIQTKNLKELMIGTRDLEKCINKIRNTDNENEYQRIETIIKINSLLMPRLSYLYTPEIALLSGDTLELDPNNSYSLPVQILSNIKDCSIYKNPYGINTVTINTGHYKKNLEKKEIYFELTDEHQNTVDTLKKVIYIKYKEPS